MIFFKRLYLTVTSEKEFWLCTKEPERDEETGEWIPNGDYANLGELDVAKEDGLAPEFWNMTHEDDAIRVDVHLDIYKMEKSKCKWR